MKRALLALQDSAFEAFLSFVCVLSGIPILFALSLAPSPLLAILPVYIVIAWALALVLGGVFDLIGIVSGNLYVRRAGLALLAAGAFIIGFAIQVAVGWAKPLSLGVYLAFSLAAGAKYVQLGRIVRARRQRLLDFLHEREGGPS